MDSFNKVISFVLGLVVVIVFFAVVTGRLNLRQKLPFLTKGVFPIPSPTKTISPTPTLTSTPTSTVKINSVYNRYQTSQGKTPTTIPATGSPTIFIPIITSGLALGFYLRKSR